MLRHCAQCSAITLEEARDFICGCSATRREGACQKSKSLEDEMTSLSTKLANVDTWWLPLLSVVLTPHINVPNSNASSNQAAPGLGDRTSLCTHSIHIHGTYSNRELAAPVHLPAIRSPRAYSTYT